MNTSTHGSNSERPLSELFTVERGKGGGNVVMGDLVSDSDGVPVVSSSAANNGVTMRVNPYLRLSDLPSNTTTDDQPAESGGDKDQADAEKEPKPVARIFPAGSLTVAINGSVLSTFVQPEPFMKTTDVVVLTPKREMTLEEKMWWVACIKAHQFRFNYGRKAGSVIEHLPLPTAVPDWVQGSEKKARQEIAKALWPDASANRADEN